MRPAGGWVAAALLALGGGIQGQEEREEAVWRLREVRLGTRNVFSEQEAREHLFYRLANRLHVPTDPEVVRRELWFGPGDRVRAQEVEELERNLRAMGLFGQANARLVPVDDAVADLEVATRDRFSLVLGAAAGHVGGVTKFNATAAEHNILGTGKEISATYRGAGDERTADLTWFDPQLLGTWHTLTARVGETEEGPFGLLSVRRPFKHLADPVSWGADLWGARRTLDYYERGLSVAAVPEDRAEAALFAAGGFGPRDLRATAGGDVRLRHSDFSPARGRDRDLVRVPGDTLELQAGSSASLDWVHSYRKVTRLDSIDFVEDLQLGSYLQGRLAQVLRSERGRSTELQHLLEAGTRTAFSPLEDTYVTLEARGASRLHGTATRGWSAAAALHVFQMSLPAQTLAASIAFDGAGETQDVLPQFTLGEDNGLRGYPAREFGGTRRVRVNLEDRIFTGIEVLSVHMGLVAFHDIGWIWGPETSFSLEDSLRSAGVGLRLGSSNLFGGGVLRLDLAWPLDRVDGRRHGPSLSVSVGQVFTFFGNRSELRSDF